MSNFPETARGWRKLKFSCRSLVVLYLLGWAIKITPPSELGLQRALLAANNAVLTFDEAKEPQ